MDGVVNNKVNAVAGEEAELKCTVAGARPTPAVLWKIGKIISHWYEFLNESWMVEIRQT